MGFFSSGCICSLNPMLFLIVKILNKKTVKAETGRTTHSEQSIFCLQIYKYNHHFVSKEHGNG